MVAGTAVWFGTAGFEVLAVIDDGKELAMDVETTPAAVGCSACGTQAVPKDRPPTGWRRSKARRRRSPVGSA